MKRRPKADVCPCTKGRHSMRYWQLILAFVTVNPCAVEQERGENIGDSIGYTIRLESKCGMPCCGTDMCSSILEQTEARVAPDACVGFRGRIQGPCRACCRGGPHSSLMFCTNGVLLRMLTQGEGLQVSRKTNFAACVVS